MALAGDMSQGARKKCPQVPLVANLANEPWDGGRFQMPDALAPAESFFFTAVTR